MLKAKQADRKRPKVRPDNPTDIGFELHTEYTADGFLQADAKSSLLLATMMLTVVCIRSQ